MKRLPIRPLIPLTILFSLLTACLPPTFLPPRADAATDSPAPATVTLTPLPPTATLTPLPPLTEIPLAAGRGVRGAWFELYFTDPDSPLASQETGGVDGPLVAAIDAARLSVDAAIYSLSLDTIRDALIRAHQRGVTVRVVMESDNSDRADPRALVEAGIPVLGDRREGLMHDKFVVIDRSEVWTGSMNFTDSGAYKDNNVLIRIRSLKAAENYLAEFEEMFLEDLFGSDIRAATPNPRLSLDGTVVENYFSPDDGVALRLKELLDDAQESIYFMAYSFTADELGQAIRARSQTGQVAVAGVMDDSQVKSNIGTEFDPFVLAGLDVRRDGNEGLMHHKTMIVDGQIVVLGSYNFTASAEIRNDENLLIIYNADIAGLFLEEFRRIFDQAQP